MIYTPANRKQRNFFSLLFFIRKFFSRRKRRSRGSVTYASSFAIPQARTVRPSVALPHVPELSIRQMKAVLYLIGILILCVLIWQSLPKPVISPVSNPSEI